MDPVTLIVTAVALGAAAGMQATTEQVVKDAYAGLKALLQHKYANVDLNEVERKPKSQPKLDSLAEDLQEAGAGDDLELIEQATKVMSIMKQSGAAGGDIAGGDIIHAEDSRGFVNRPTGSVTQTFSNP